MDDKVTLSQKRLSVVIASITMVLGATFMLPVTHNPAEENPFIFVERLLPLLVAVLAYLGTIWVFAETSTSKVKIPQRQMLIHLILPTLSIYILTLALIQMERNATWWWVYLSGILLYAAVVVSENQDLSSSQNQAPLAGILLIALSHALFFILAVVFKLGLLRLIFVVPGIFLAATFISLRMIKQRTDQIKPGWIFIVGFVVTQLAGALFYFFITPVQYALILTALLYSLISLASGYIEKRKGRSLFFEPILMLVIVLIIFIMSTLWM
jgi:hypothetical protein